MNFRPIRETEPELLKRYLGGNPSRICETTYGVIFMWDVYEDRTCCIEDGTLFLASFKPDAAIFNYPIGGDERNALIKIKEYCAEKNLKLKLLFVPEDSAELVRDVFGVDLEKDRDWADYVYLTEDLQNLSGKKYHGQKNHFNQFVKNFPDYEYIEYSPAEKSSVLEFYEKFYSENEKNDELFYEEKKVFLRLLDNFEASGQTGGIIKIGGKTVAVSFGETVGDTLYIHIEKALREYAGSYAAINRLFALKNGKDAKYINREEDVGDEGLRTAKLSLHPVMLVEKYFASVSL